MNKKLKHSFWGSLASFDLLAEVLLLVIVFLVPIIFDRRLGIVFSGTKIAWLRCFASVALGLWAVKLVVWREHRFVRTALDWPVAAFLLSTTIATITSIHVYTSLAGFYGRYEGLTTWYIYGLLFFIVTNYFRTSRQLLRIVMAVLPAASIMSLYSIIQRQEIDPYQWGGVITWQRVIGTIGQPNFLAGYMVMAFFLLLAVFLFKDDNWHQPVDWLKQFPPVAALLFSQAAFIFMIYTYDAGDVLLWYLTFALITAAALYFAFYYERLHPKVLDAALVAVLLLIYVCILYTQSRGGYMGFFTGAVLFALITGRKYILENWLKLAVLGGLIVLISALTMLRPDYSPFDRFTGEISAGQESQLELKGAAGSRGETWKSNFKMVTDYPLFGIGPEAMKMVFPRYETDLFRFKETFHVKQDRAHNETLDVSVKHGLITFFIYLWLLYTLFSFGFKKAGCLSGNDRLLTAGLLAACLAYLIQNQFSFGVVAITSLFWVMWGMVMAVGEDRDRERNEGGTLKIDQIPWFWVALIALAVAAVSYVGFLSFNGDIYYKSGKTKLEMRQLPAAVDDLKVSLDYMPLEGGTVSHLAISQLNQGQVKQAIETLNYGIKIDPYNADNYFMLARIYYFLSRGGSADDLAQAKSYAERSARIDPYYAEVFILLGMISEQNGGLDQAAALYEKALFLNPNLSESPQLLKNVNSRRGKTRETEEIFSRALKRFGSNINVTSYLILRGDR